MIDRLVKKNFDLAKFTTFRIGGKAEFFMIVKNKRELLDAVGWAEKRKSPISILGGGSNVLIARRKIKGLVLKIAGENYSVKKNNITCWAGMSLSKLSNISAAAGLAGLEWSFGIPGTVGGAVRGNSGAYGLCMSDAVEEVEAYDLVENKLIKLNNKACGFGYRDSVFKKRKNLLIAEVKLKLAKGKIGEIKSLSGKNFDYRFERLPKEPSAGCVFKNLEYKNIARKNKALAEDLAAKGLMKGGKIGVGYLIDQLGMKGKAIGGAKVSEKHANFIVNTGKAKAEDVIKLIKLIKNKIKNKYKINLEEEIQYF